MFNGINQKKLVCADCSGEPDYIELEYDTPLCRSCLITHFIYNKYVGLYGGEYKDEREI